METHPIKAESLDYSLSNEEIAFKKLKKDKKVIKDATLKKIINN